MGEYIRCHLRNVANSHQKFSVKSTKKFDGSTKISKTCAVRLNYGTYVMFLNQPKQLLKKFWFGSIGIFYTLFHQGINE
jgi:hypothetical protein